MNSSTNNSPRTPLEYLQMAIESLHHTQDDLKAELEELREFREAFFKLKAELEELKEFQEGFFNLKAELKESREDFFNLKAEYEITKRELNTEIAELKQVQENYLNLQSELAATKSELKQVRDEIKKVESNCQKQITDVSEGIKNGSIVAQKALMLRGRDNNHWMRFKYMKKEKYDTFLIWNNKGYWQHTVRVGAADKKIN